MCVHKVQEIVESLQQVKHKGGSRPPIRTLGMGDVSGDCGNFATCNPFQRVLIGERDHPYMVRYTLSRCKDFAISCN